MLYLRFGGTLVAIVLIVGSANANDQRVRFDRQEALSKIDARPTLVAHGGDWQAIGCNYSSNACHDHAHEHGYIFSRVVHDHQACEDHPHMLCLGRN